MLRLFLVISKPLKGRRPRLSGGKLRDVADGLAQAMERGTLVAAYAMLAGGTVYVFRSRSKEHIESQLRRHPLFQFSETSVVEVIDAEEFLESGRGAFPLPVEAEASGAENAGGTGY